MHCFQLVWREINADAIKSEPWNVIVIARGGGGDARLEELWRDHLINVVYAVTPKSESCVVTRFVGALREADLYDSAPTRRTEPVDASLS